MANTETAARPRNSTELVSRLNAQMAGSNTPRSSIFKLVTLLENDGFITYDPPAADQPLVPADLHHVVRVLEENGYRLTKRTASPETTG